MDDIRKQVEQGLTSDAERQSYQKLGQAYEHYDTMFREQIVPAVERELEQRLKKLDGQSDQALAQVAENISAIVASLNQGAKEATGSYRETAGFVQWIIMVLSGSAVLIGLLAGFFLSRGIARPIRQVVVGLRDAAGQVAGASGQVSSSSQSLAEGASEQAASLEETGASLEQLNSMTSRNAENASQADDLMRDTAEVVEQASSSMHELTKAMAVITTASEETVKIVKTIDEIAFQTNLLALNAAVEAARAGEAGAGFAVVADEVRNLAMRAAEAAKITHELIEQSLGNIKRGSKLANGTSQAFEQVSGSSGKVAALVSDIAKASGEQAQGIAQITKAAGEMEQVTQRVAGNAEEAAAASEELSAQSQVMLDCVEELSGVVEGSRVKTAASEAAWDEPPEPVSEPKKLLPKPQAKKPAPVSPKQELPLDDEDFADF